MTVDNPKAGKTFFINSVWAIATRMSIRFLGVISIIILARLLSPDDFGIVAKAVMIQSFLELVSSLGLETALITDQKAGKEHYNTVWTLQILRGMLIGLVLAALAGPAAVYFHEPELTIIIYAYAAISFFGGFYNIGVVDFRKHLEFNRDFRYNLYKKVIAFATTITIAFIWQTYWALVAGVAAAMLTTIISSFIMSSYRPKLTLLKWRDLFHFSKWMMIHEIMASLAYQVDSFILARFSTANILGVYVVSSELAHTPTSELAMSVSRAASPSLAKFNDNLVKLKDLYQKSLALMVLIAVPAGVGISVLSQELVNLFLGAKWQEAVPLIEIMAIYGIFTLFTANSISALISAGRINILAYLSTTRIILRTSALVIGFMINGVMGMVIAALCAVILYVFISLSMQQYYKIFHFVDLFVLSWRSLVSAVVMYFGLISFKSYLYSSFELGDILNTAAIVLAGGLIYGCCLLLLWQFCRRCEGPENDIIQFILKRGNA